MAVFESKYKELGFYCCGELRTFKSGRYVTEKECEIKVLESLADTKRVDEPKKVAEEVVVKLHEGETVRPAPKKKATPKKSSGK